MRVESAYSPISEPSPWWLKGLAIFMGIITLFMVLGTISAIASPIIIDRLLPVDYEEVEPYPVDGSEEEKAEWSENEVFWNEVVEYYDEMGGLMEIQGVHSGILVIVGLFSTLVLWRGDRDLGIKLVGSWIAINAIGGAGLFWMFMRIGLIPDFTMNSQDVEVIDLSFVENLTLVIGWGQIIICNGFFVAILALVSMKSKPEVMLDARSDSPVS
ncbi:MAG: hypothetical protein L7R66_04000 [Candidatus Thalassarchaeaceae archaeon]|nr:hypothetical protein [Candidatus Thalassarchaeaceae archaeon]